MNAKLDKIKADIEKTQAKIAELQDKKQKLERQRTEIENTEILALFRKERLTEDEFISYIKARRDAAGRQNSIMPAAHGSQNDGTEAEAIEN